MNANYLALLALPALALAACASPPSAGQFPSTWSREPGPEVHVQGLLGITELSGAELNSSELTFSDEGQETLPAFGSVWQLPRAGKKLQFGLEAGFTFGFERDSSVKDIDGGGSISVDSELFIADFFVGPYASLKLGDSLRFYAALGPLLQYGRVDFDEGGDSDGLPRDTDDSFEGGTYVRCGVELLMTRDTFVGFGVRWIDSSLDLQPDSEPLEFQGTQYLLTVATGF